MTRFLTALLALILPSAGLAGDFSFTYRGGVSTAVSSYPYAYSTSGLLYDPLVDDLAESSFGSGGYVALGGRVDDVGPFQAIEFGASLFRFQGEDTFLDQPTSDGNCAPPVYDLAGTATALCFDGAYTTSNTSLTTARALASHELAATGTELLAGIGYLSAEMSTAGGLNFPGENSAIVRQSAFRGLGLVVGLRKSLPVGPAALLKLEAIAGAYRGRQEMQLDEIHVTAASTSVGSLTVSDTTTALAADLSVGFSFPAQRISPGAKSEVGLVYSAVSGVFDTANYNGRIGNPTGAASPTGSTRDGTRAVTLYFGLTIPQ